MGFIYIILSVLCRLLPLGTLFGVARCLRCVSSSSVNGENDSDVYAVWLPAVGWWTVWTARSESGQVNPVRCTLSPDGSLRISITTPKRTLSFDTRYRVLSGGA